MIENTEENNAKVIQQIERLSTKRRWSRLAGAQFELARVARKYARDLKHLEVTIDDMCEEWPECPDSRELKQELTGKHPGDLDRWEPDWLKERKAKQRAEREDLEVATEGELAGLAKGKIQ